MNHSDEAATEAASLVIGTDESVQPSEPSSAPPVLSWGPAWSLTQQRASHGIVRAHDAVAETESPAVAEPMAGEAAPSEPSAGHAPGWEWSREAPRLASSTEFPSPSLATGQTGVYLAPAAPSVPPALPLAEAKPRRLVRPKGRFAGLRLDLVALVLAVAGGFMGLVGAFLTELQSGGAGLVLVIIGAPVVEEALKPSGIYLLLVILPYALRSRFHAAILCAISGAVFGVVESLLYTEIYFPEGGENFILFRFTVTPAMHAVASFLVGYGLSRATLEWAKGERPLPKETRNFFLAGMGLHAAYNTIAVVAGIAGWLDFLED